MACHRKTRLETGDALPEACQPCGKFAGIIGHRVARRGEPYPSVLGLADRRFKIAQALSFLPLACFEGAVEPKIEHALDEAQPLAQRVRVRIVRRSLESGFEPQEIPPLRLLGA